MDNSVVSEALQLICEGSVDEELFRRLITARNITSFQVRCARKNDEKGCSGLSGITNTVAAVLGAGSLRGSIVKGMLIAVDSDDDPLEAFAAVCESLVAAELPSIPSQLLEIKPGGSKPSSPAVAVLTVPWTDRKGNVETLILEALQRTYADLVAPVDEFCRLTDHRIGSWSFGKKSKMRLRSTIAASYKTDPGISLSYYLQSERTCPIDFQHPIFDQICGYLEAFKTAVLGGV